MLGYRGPYWKSSWTPCGLLGTILGPLGPLTPRGPPRSDRGDGGGGSGEPIREQEKKGVAVEEEAPSKGLARFFIACET